MTPKSVEPSKRFQYMDLCGKDARGTSVRGPGSRWEGSAACDPRSLRLAATHASPRVAVPGHGPSTSRCLPAWPAIPPMLKNSRRRRSGRGLPFPSLPWPLNRLGHGPRSLPVRSGGSNVPNAVATEGEACRVILTTPIYRLSDVQTFSCGPPAPGHRWGTPR
jgi:hypothetical protein